MFASRIARFANPITTFTRTNTTVTAALVKELRELTGAPMMECKKALTNVLADDSVDSSSKNNVMSAASEWLRKRGSQLAATKSNRSAKEGAVVYAISGDRRKGALVEVNCETDFVARNNIFLGFATRSALAALESTVAVTTVDPELQGVNIDYDEFMQLSLPEGPAAMTINPNAASNNISQELVDVVTNCRENVRVARAGFVEVPAGKTGFVAPYLHNELPTPEELRPYIEQLAAKGIQVKFGNSAALTSVVVDGTEYSEDTYQLCRKLSMQSVAAKPQYLTVNNVPAEIIAAEKAKALDTINTTGKDEATIERIINGKLGKFLEERVLVEQQFVITNDTKKPIVRDLLKEDAGKPEIVQVLRYTCGEFAPEGTAEE